MSNRNIEPRKFRKVFIVGFPRSGTTLLYHLLTSSSHFPTYDYSETHFFSHYFMRFGDLRLTKNREKFLAALEESDWVSASRLDVRKIAKARVGELTYGGIFEALMNATAEAQGKMCWVEKTPWHILYLDVLMEHFPDAKIAFVSVLKSLGVLGGFCIAS